MTGWVTVNRIGWVLRNKIEAKFADPTIRACLVTDSDRAGMVYYKKGDVIEVLFSFHNEDELDEIFEEFQNNKKEVKLDEKTNKFVVVKIKEVRQPAYKEQDKAKQQGPLFKDSTADDSDIGDNPFFD